MRVGSTLTLNQAQQRETRLRLAAELARPAVRLLGVAELAAEPVQSPAA